MTKRISDLQLSQLSQFVAAQMGLYFPRERWRDLEREIGFAAQEFDFTDVESFIPWLVSSPLTRDQIETLASHLTVGETYFFREKRSFEVLEQHILPELIRSRSGIKPYLKIWSAGCCTGEEPYSVAMLLDKLIPDITNWHITILATDINARFLHKAAEGVYSEWSFRNAPQWVKEKYFSREEDGRFTILPSLKEMVKFAYLNLVEGAQPLLLPQANAIDIIFCRNVLMYFAPEPRKKAVQNLYRSLADNGWLMVSPSETSQTIYPHLATVHFPAAIFYRKVASSEFRVEGSGLQAPGSDTKRETANPKPETPQNPSEPIVAPEEVKGQKTAEPRPIPYGEAVALYEQGRYGEAVEKLTAISSKPGAGVVLANPDYPKAIALLARAYANQGKLTEALAWCERAVRADKLNPRLHYLWASILQEQDAVDEAVASLRRALYLDPNFVLAHFALGNLRLRQGKSQEAQKHLENALALLPAYRQEDPLPESEGLTAGRLAEIIVSLIRRETLT